MLTRSHTDTIESSKSHEQERKMYAMEKEPTIADLMKELRSGNTKTGLQLENMDTTLKDNTKMTEDYIVKKDQVVNKMRS